MKRPFLDANTAHPVTLPTGEVHRKTVFLNQVISHPNFEIGDYTYCSDFDEITDYAAHLAPYLFEGSRERLIIGKFCQIAHGVRFVTASANHPMDGFSTFPFSIFDPATMGDYAHIADLKGDTIIGNDVWLGYGATILPGARIGDGAIIGAKAVVGGTIPPYSVVGGNPGKVVRQRFDPDTIQRLVDAAWWDWHIDLIGAERAAIEGHDIDRLEAAARRIRDRPDQPG